MVSTTLHKCKQLKKLFGLTFSSAKQAPSTLKNELKLPKQIRMILMSAIERKGYPGPGIQKAKEGTWVLVSKNQTLSSAQPKMAGITS